MKHFDNQQKRRRVTRLALLKLKSNKKHMVTREILLGRPEFIYIFLDNENSLDEYKKRKGEREKELEVNCKLQSVMQPICISVGRSCLSIGKLANTDVTLLGKPYDRHKFRPRSAR